MIIETFSRPKARDFSVPSDDVVIHIPGRFTGVFDGASDGLGRKVGGVPVGRLAAMAAANKMAALPPESAEWPAKDILGHLSAAIATHVPTEPDEGPASTTAMIALETADGVRMLGIGDTGFRINGGPVHITELAPDTISIPARVALFKLFQETGADPDQCELAARRAISTGLLSAVKDDVLTARQANDILDGTLATHAKPAAVEDAIRLLNHGLQSQFHLANAMDAPLGYGVLNGTTPDIRHAIDQRFDRADIDTIEIFSDGYLRAPTDVSIAAWENAHAETERTDPHKILHALAVKGSTPSHFFDDRTVAILRNAGPQEPGS